MKFKMNYPKPNNDRLDELVNLYLDELIDNYKKGLKLVQNSDNITKMSIGLHYITLSEYYYKNCIKDNMYIINENNMLKNKYKEMRLLYNDLIKSTKNKK